MLERAEILWTWELQALPTPWRAVLGSGMANSTGPAAEPVRASRLADHRRAYLDHEGSLSHHRGSVSCCDRGTYTMLHETSARLEIQLAGNRLRGRVVLELEKDHQDHWRLWAVG